MLSKKPKESTKENKENTQGFSTSSQINCSADLLGGQARTL